MSNDATKVSTGKPKVGGAVYWAPYGTVLPTDATTALNEAFMCLGFVSEDGLTNENSPETEDVKAWGGEVVATLQSEKTDTFTFKLIESLNVYVLKAIYGSDNVSGTAISSGITVRANSEEVDSACWVFDMVMRGEAVKRIVVPNGKITELGEIVYKDDEPIGYEPTLRAMPGDQAFGYDTHKEYIQSTKSE